MLDILVIKCLTDNFSYLIRDTNTNTIGVVDPSEFSAVDNEIQKKYKKLDFILNTHHHDDHIGGNLDLKKKYNSKIVCSEHDKNTIIDADVLFNDGDSFKFGEVDFNVLHIPGHTLGHIAFYSKKAGVVFTGDTLFSLGCGRIFEGSLEQMFNSIEKIKNLPSDTLIYCGHEYTENNGKFAINIDNQNNMLREKIKDVASKIKKGVPSIPVSLSDELNTNIFLRCEDKKIKNKLKMPNASKQEVFSKLRNLKDQF